MPYERVGDVDLYYELTDFCEPWANDRTPVLFIHGLGGNHRMWLPQVPAFCGRYPVLTVDLRNHGESTKLDRESSVAEMAADLTRLLRTLGVGAAHVVGLSLGGMIALQMTLDAPEAVAALVLADTLAGAPPGFEEVGRQALALIESSTMAEIARVRITAAFSGHVDPAVRDYFVGQVARNQKPAYVRAARAGFAFNARERLRDVKRPTLVVVGEEDVTTPPMLSEELASGIPGARLVRIAGAAHISNVERPREFNDAVLGFLDSL
jgi:3-oxoadipate enol-lactonase